MDQKIVNLCAHDLTIKDAAGHIRVICPSGKECRVDVLLKDVEYHDGIEVHTDVYDAVHDLPEERKGVLYVVSAKVTNALNGSRNDVVSPGRQIKDKTTGKVLFSIGLRRKF